MDYYHSHLRWHPRFQARLQADTKAASLLLLSRTEAFRLVDPDVLTLAELVEGQQTLARAFEGQDLPAHRLPRLLNLLGSLTQGQWMLDAERALALPYRVPDFNGPYAQHRLTAKVDVLVLPAQWDQAALMAQLLPLVADYSASALTLILCEDYFDPRLAAAQSEQIALGRSCLPIEIQGSQVRLGPWLNANHSPGPCWHCLGHRLLRKRPTQMLWQGVADALHQGLPLALTHQPLSPCSPSFAPSQVLPHCAPALHSLLAQPGSPLLHFNLPEQPSTWRSAPVQRRPQCAHCGDPQLTRQRQMQAIRPQAGPNTLLDRGTSRLQAAQATLQRLGDWVGPVCGLVDDLQAVPQSGDAPLKVFQTRFGHPPRHDPRTGAYRLEQICLGKGMSSAQCQASALGESIERYSAYYQGDEAITVAPARSLDGPWHGPGQLVFLSAQQGQASAAAPHASTPPHKARNTQLQAYTPDQAMAWVSAWSLTHDRRSYLPLPYCYAAVPEPWAAFCEWNSNGCAAGNTLEEAILQGLFEVVERDAVAVWWYNQVPRPCWDLDGLAAERRALIDQSLGPDWEYWCLDLSHDVGLPVAAAIAHQRHNPQWAFGFGCSVSPSQACERALTEMLQLVAVGNALPLTEWPRHSPAAQFLEPKPQTPSALTGDLPAAATDAAALIAHCVALAERQGLEVLVHNYGRSDLPLHQVKVVLPGACHIWPELANPRLYQVPEKLGWQAARTENQLNPRGLFV